MPAIPTPKTDAFFDSDILLYVPDLDISKSQRAEGLLAEGGVISAHVLGEFVNVMRGKKWKRDWPEIQAHVLAFRANTIVLPVTADTHARGMAYAERYKLQFFDALHVASAVMANCTTFWTEDMHAGLVVDGLTLRNPFR